MSDKSELFSIEFERSSLRYLKHARAVKAGRAVWSGGPITRIDKQHDGGMSDSIDNIGLEMPREGGRAKG